MAWCNNFVTFIDTMAQLLVLQRDVDRLFIPTFIRKVVINVKEHYEILSTLGKENTGQFKYYIYNISDRSRRKIKHF